MWWASTGLSDLLGAKWVVISWSSVLWALLAVGITHDKKRDDYEVDLPSREECIKVYGVEAYDRELRGVVYVIERTAPYVLGSLIAVCLSLWLFTSTSWETAATALYGSVSIGWFLIYRQIWKWKHRPLTYDPTTGYLTEWETENWWLLIPGSAPEKYILEKSALRSPTRSFIDKMFGTQSLTVVLDDGGGTRVLRRLKNYQLITKIYDMRGRIPTEMWLAIKEQNELKKRSA